MNLVVSLLVGVLLCGLCAAQPLSDSQQEEVDLELEEVSSLDGIDDETAQESTTAPGVAPSMVLNCSDAILGVYLRIQNGRKLRSLTTSSTLDCCVACYSDERCNTWSRRRYDGLCKLFKAELAEYQIDLFRQVDIGGSVLREAVLFLFLRAPITSLLRECNVTRGVAYPDGTVLAQGHALSASYCCEICRQSRDCNSWYYDRRNNRCTLNRDVPSSVNQNSWKYSGGTALD